MPCRLGLNRAGTWLLVTFGVRVHQSRSPAASMSSKRPVDRWIHLITPHHKVVPRPQNPATPNPIARIPLPFFSALVSSPTALKFCQGAMFPPLPGLPKLDKLLLQLLSQAIASAEGLVFSLPSCFTRTTTATPMVKSSLAAAPRQSRRPSSARGAAHPNCPFQRPPRLLSPSEPFASAAASVVGAVGAVGAWGAAPAWDRMADIGHHLCLLARLVARATTAITQCYLVSGLNRADF